MHIQYALFQKRRNNDSYDVWESMVFVCFRSLFNVRRFILFLTLVFHSSSILDIILYEYRKSLDAKREIQNDKCKKPFRVSIQLLQIHNKTKHHKHIYNFFIITREIYMCIQNKTQVYYLHVVVQFLFWSIDWLLKSP